MHSPEGVTGTFWDQFNHPSPALGGSSTRAVGQEVACDNQDLPGHSKKPCSCKRTDSAFPPQPFLLSKPCLSQGQRELRGTAMLPVTHILAFGAWLVVQSMTATSDPNVTIYLQPPGVIPLGGSTTIHCECQYNGGSFVLYRNGHQFRSLKTRGSRAEFSISNATRSFSGPYSCHYLHGDDGAVLARSDTLEVLVEELQGPKPVLSILPGHEVAAGSDVLLRCIFPYANAICFLYLEGQAGTLHNFPEKEAKFYLSQVEQGNGGRYSCQCYTKGTPPKWSSTSEYLELVVRESQLPSPSISVTPPDGAILGTPATIHCKCPCQGTAMLLYKAGDTSARQTAQLARDVATFTIARVDKEDGGTYTCRYGNESDPSSLSQSSHSVELLVRDPGLARPSLFLEPLSHVQPGTNVTLLCTGVGQNAQVYFWRDREMVKNTEPEGDVATFVLPHVMGHHGGTYACTYHPRQQPYLSSELSSTVWLVVADYTWGNTVRLALGAGILVLLGLIVAEAMHSHRPTPAHLSPL
ncbi:immunoglobulin superfamily member 1-like isoform X1 [Apteryx rowi]|uniref:immunoglobulin superfamily member 1-like isoform X1 n=1 Tax=Apteryx rowi TaxID=308060 RepID=UPI000E1D23FA|nr:immunoglobulin superfamily member 1-like isoform X1 [Apteryx rowi]